MAELNLKEKTQNVTQEFELVTVAKDVEIKFRKDVIAGKRRFSGVAVQNGKEIGRATWSDDSNHMIVNVTEINTLGDAKALEVTDTLYRGVLQMLNA